MIVKKVLEPQPSSFDNAYIIKSYPFGRQRCQRRVWIESNKRGDRFRAQCSKKHVEHNKELPAFVEGLGGGDSELSNQHWHKAKKGIYMLLALLYLDEKDYIICDGLNFYPNKVEVENFVEKFKGHRLPNNVSEWLANFEELERGVNEEN